MANNGTRRRDALLGFEALSIEGGLLAPEWLAKISRLEAGNQAAVDYRVPKGLDLRDEIGRYWRIAQAHWAEFSPLVGSTADPRGLAERFVTSLLKDAFGFESMKPVQPVHVQDRTFPIGFAAVGGRVPVVIAPADFKLDTQSPAFGEEGRRRSAFGLVQECLTACPDAGWGLASDGVTLRIVRHNPSLTRPAWIEADLGRIFTEERFADFAALWLLAHESRFGREDGKPSDAPLEVWRNKGREEGTRALGKLRGGVTDALHALGQGFIAHPLNTALRADLESGALSGRDYFNQLLRLVYRLIFLLTAEDRDVLHASNVDAETRGLYADGYSIRRLAALSARRSAHDRHADLWEAVKIVLQALQTGEPRLGLPALAGLFAGSQCPALDGAALENRALLLAIYKLAWLRSEAGLSKVNWRDMGPEELGSVYEGLLELHPEVSVPARTFRFAEESRGNARKTTGSYYTPDSLVQVLLDSALEPVIQETLAKNPEKPIDALLSLSIVDPACGSGHFLLAAARRLAAHIARIAAGGTASLADYRHALRQVVGRCIYGVDLNPMAVELCKVGLWMEAVEPGLPLTFLDAHIRCGNALLGTTPELMERGIPDEAWEAIEGDDKKVASRLKKRNKAERTGQLTMVSGWTAPAESEADKLRAEMAKLDALSDEAFLALAAKEALWAEILTSRAYEHQKLVADAWCAAFVWPKPGDNDALVEAAPTTGLWRDLRDGRGQVPALTIETVEDLADRYQLFHWHLAFPTIFEKRGFDLVLGNPPWVRQELLKPEKRLLTQFSSYASTADSSVYFLERAVQVSRVSGQVAMLTPNKWFRAAYAQELRSYLRRRCRVDLVVDFGHSRTMFPDADAFPALITLRPVAESAVDDELAIFVRAHDSDLRGVSLRERLSGARVLVAHRSLRPDRWQLEDKSVGMLLDRLLTTGRPLDSLLERPILRGVLSGFNEAYYVDSQTRDALVAANPACEFLFKRLLRGRDIKRWQPEWAGMWHIVIPSSQNRAWPWSGAASELEAEEAFARTYPSVQARLKKFERQLRARQDRGTLWWELRACDYYDAFEVPKIVVQRLAFYSQFALDGIGHITNDKAVIVPSDDPYLLAILNSRITWWIINRTFQHMKDEGLSVDNQFLKRVPIPDPPPSLREEIGTLSTRLIFATSGHERASIEIQLDGLVNQAFALSPDELRVLVESLPPRDPIEGLAVEHMDASVELSPLECPQYHRRSELVESRED
jgi:hypothetical protein